MPSHIHDCRWCGLPPKADVVRASKVYLSCFCRLKGVKEAEFWRKGAELYNYAEGDFYIAIAAWNIRNPVEEKKRT